MRAARPAIAATLITLSACSLAPDYRPPVTPIPAAFKEAPAGWSVAQPGDQTPRGPWWTVFADPVLNELEARIEPGSPTLAAALARFDAATAAARGAAADLYPSVSANAQVSRQRVSGRRPLTTAGSDSYTNAIIGGALDYEFDLWGRVRNTVRAERADAQASEADLENVRLSLQANLADAYWRLRGLDAQAALLDETVAAFTQARDLTNTRHEGGIASGLDVSRAQTVLSGARAETSDIANRRAAAEHEIAALVGEAASSFTIPRASRELVPPDVPAILPSQLLERRPDVARAERMMAAFNARIGVARAALYPAVSLGASGGFEAARGLLLSSPATYWALGPLAALLTVFDGGRRRAQVRISRGQYDEAAANYRETVLTAFREVEDALAAIRTLRTQSGDQRASTTAANRTRDLALTRYRDGASDYLEVVTAQTAALDAERAALAVDTQRMQAVVALVRSTGQNYETLAFEAAPKAAP